jgi:translocation and assembly module TamB
MNDAAPNAPIPQPARLPRKARRWLLAMLVVVVLAAAALVWMAWTTSGLRLLSGAIERVSGGAVSVSRAEGTLMTGPVWYGLDVRLPSASLSAARLSLSWQPRRLLERELRVHALEARDLVVALRENAEAGEPLIAMPEFVLPLDLVLERLLIDGLTVQPAGARAPLLFPEVAAALDWRGSELSLSRLDATLDQPAAGVHVEGRLAMQEAWPFDLGLRWRLALEDGDTVEGEGRVDGDLNAIRLTHQSSGAVRTDLTGRLDDLLGEPRWQASLVVADVRPEKLFAEMPAGVAGGSIVGRGSFSSLALEGTLDATLETLPDPGGLHARLQVGLSDGLLELTELQLTTDPGEGILDLVGSYRIAGPDAGAFEADLSWESLGWPLDPTPRYASPGGRLQASGTPDRFRHELTARLEGVDIPPADLSWSGIGNLRALEFDALEIVVLDGRVQGGGELAYSPEMAWALDVTAAGIDPSVFWPDLAAQLGARLATSGRLGESPEASVELRSLDGTLLGRPVSGDGSLRWRPSGLEVDGLSLSAGANTLIVTGGTGEALDLIVSVDAPDFSQLLPDAAGSLRLDARVTGELARPEIGGDLAASGIVFGGVRVDALEGSAQVPVDPGGLLDVDLQGRGIRVGKVDWRNLELKAEGTPAEHRLDLVLKGEPVAAEASAVAGWSSDSSYAGTLEQLVLSSAAAGGWRLVEPVAFAAGAQQWSLGQACVESTQGSGSVCLEAGGEGSDWRGEARVTRLALGLLAPLLPQGVEMEGEVRGEAGFSAIGNRLDGNARLDVVSGRSSVDLGDAEQRLDFSGASLQIAASGGGLGATLGVPLAGLGRLDAEVRLDDWRLDDPLRSSQPVAGTLKGGVSDLSPLVSVLPQLAEPTGRVDVDLAVAGSLGSSTLSGALRLDGAGFDVPDLGVSVRELSLAARSRSLDVLEYEGQGKIGDGTIELGGESRRTADGMKTRLSVRGERLVVADIPEARVVVSPDLEISVDRERAMLGGTVVVPEALLQPVSIPAGAVAPSRDVVVLGEDGEEGGVRLATATDVRLRLGDAVRFDGFGLSGLIQGDLRVTQEPGRLALGNGQLSVQDGTFSAFGVELPIQQGRLIFANTPVDDPGINVVARREFSDATVGARVAGTLKAPQLTFFSNPAMGQAEALNYLLTGGQSRSGTTGATLVGGSFLLREAGSRIGISDIGLTQAAGSENLSVYVGTYLNPRLYMQYITEMGEQANRVRFRYDLTRRLQAEVETGDVQSGTIFFTIER